MNAKKAKALRKLLRNAQKMNPHNNVPEVAYKEDVKKRKFVEIKARWKPSEIRDGLGEAPSTLDQIMVMGDVKEFSGVIAGDQEKIERVQIAPGQITLDRRSVRGIYHQLKKKVNEEAGGAKRK
jgi:hypothetical protein